jgi:hypothetical protein
MTVNRGDVVLVDYPFTTGGAKVRPALVVQNDRDKVCQTPTRWRGRQPATRGIRADRQWPSADRPMTRRGSERNDGCLLYMPAFVL